MLHQARAALRSGLVLDMPYLPHSAHLHGLASGARNACASAFLLAALAAVLAGCGARAADARNEGAAAIGAQTRESNAPPGAAVDRRVEIWIDLSMTPPAAWSALTAEQRARYLHDVDAQQAALMERLKAWPIVERGRVRIARNAVAVEAPESAVEAIRRLPDVVSVRPVTHRNRIQSERPAVPRAPR